MKVRFLGTGTSQGVPVIACPCRVCRSPDPRDKRLRTSILITVDNQNLVVDAGPDFRQQMLLSGVQHLNAILLTHEHNDHIIGMDDVRPFNFRARQDMPVYAVTRVQKELHKRFAYIFDNDPYPGAPRLQLHTIDAQQPFWIANTQVTPIEVMHGRLPVLGFRIGDFTYITDAKTIAPQEMQKIKGSRVLVINALHHQEHHSHLNLEQAVELAQLVEVPQTYLTHISHRMGLTAEIAPQLPGHIHLAYDGLEISL